MQYRRLGKSGLKLSALSFGSWVTFHFQVDDSPAEEMLACAYEAGVNFFDTSDVYGCGHSERSLGEVFAGRRDRVVIATKFGFLPDPDGGLSIGLNSHPDHIRKVAEQSLIDLGTDRIDLLYQHRPDPNVPPEDVAGAVGELIQEGKVLHFGMSEVGAETLRRAHAVQPVTALQTEYSLFERDVETLFPTLRELGIRGTSKGVLNRLNSEQLAIWFGILVLIVVEVGLITPPVGMNLFIINAMDRNTPMVETYKAVMFFVASDLIRVAILVAFPAITLFLIPW